jgi:hypothetical protein
MENETQAKRHQVMPLGAPAQHATDPYTGGGGGCLANLVPLQLLLLFTGCDQALLRGQQP